MGVGDKIRKILETQDLSQKEFAEILNIAPTTLSGYITNKREPDIDTLKNIALHLGVSLNYLLSVRAEDVDDREVELIQLFRILTSEQQELIFEQMKLMKKRNSRDKKNCIDAE